MYLSKYDIKFSTDVHQGKSNGEYTVRAFKWTLCELGAARLIHNAKLRISQVTFGRCFKKNEDKTASARHWMDKEPIRAMWHTQPRISESLPHKVYIAAMVLQIMLCIQHKTHMRSKYISKANYGSGRSKVRVSSWVWWGRRHESRGRALKIINNTTLSVILHLHGTSTNFTQVLKKERLRFDCLFNHLKKKHSVSHWFLMSPAVVQLRR